MRRLPTDRDEVPQRPPRSLTVRLHRCARGSRARTRRGCLEKSRQGRETRVTPLPCSPRRSADPPREPEEPGVETAANHSLAAKSTVSCPWFDSHAVSALRAQAALLGSHLETGGTIEELLPGIGPRAQPVPVGPTVFPRIRSRDRPAPRSMTQTPKAAVVLAPAASTPPS